MPVCVYVCMRICGIGPLCEALIAPAQEGAGEAACKEQHGGGFGHDAHLAVDPQRQGADLAALPGFGIEPEEDRIGQGQFGGLPYHRVVRGGGDHHIVRRSSQQGRGQKGIQRRHAVQRAIGCNRPGRKGFDHVARHPAVVLGQPQVIKVQ